MQPGALTQDGTLVGTLHYMAPEQLEGSEADARADLFAFGAVLYEMATGRRAFDGPTPASVIAAILSADPPPIPVASAPLAPALDHFVRGCLAKDPADRWQHARDLRYALDGIGVAPSPDAVPSPLIARLQRWRRVAVAAALIATAAVVAALAAWLRPVRPVVGTAARLSVPLNDDAPYFFGGGTSLAISGDGRTLVYSAGPPARMRLYQRPLDQPAATAIEGAGGGQSPFFSPDGQWIGFVAQRRLKKARLSGGGAVTLCESASFLSGTWGADGTIVFAQGPASGLFRIPADGGTPEPLTTPRPGERSHRNPEFLPDGKTVLFTVTTTETGSYDEARIEALTIASGERQVVVEGARRAWYASSGHLVYARAGGLVGVPFDLQRRRVSGAPVPVASGVWMTGSAVQAAMSDSGTLAHLPTEELNDNTRRLVWVDRRGQLQPVREERRGYLWPRISPSGSRIATVLQGANNMIWVHDLDRGTFTRVTTRGDAHSVVWTPDGQRLLYTSPAERGDALHSLAADGSGQEQTLFASEHAIDVESLTPDAAMAILTETSPTTRSDIIVIPLHGDRTPSPFLNTPAEEYGARLAPNGRWLAYASNEAGRGSYQVYVQAFPGRGERHHISTTGGAALAWAASGRELFYRNGQRMMVVDVQLAPTFRASAPRPLFDLSGTFRGEFDVSPDGQRFVMVQEAQPAPPRQINVALDWVDELTRLVPNTAISSALRR
jgi:serine/threonine-protein kinase